MTDNATNERETRLNELAARPAGPLTLADLDGLNSDELRRLCRQRGLARGIVAASLKMADAIALLTGATPATQEATPATQEATPAPQATPAAPDKATALQALIDVLSTPVDVTALKAEIMAEIQRRIEALTLPRKVEITVNGATPVTFDAAHAELPELIRTLKRGQFAWLYGPSGSGKSHAAKQAALALGLPFATVSCGQGMTASKLFGQRYATGDYKPSALRSMMEQNAGVFCIDEIDAAPGEILIELNSLLSNKYHTFPDGETLPLGNVLIVAGANTIGLGATKEFAARAVIDGATRDRFAFMAWDYDETLEAQLAAATGYAGAAAWVKRVQALRRAAKDVGVTLLITPRASIEGARALADGALQSAVENAWIWRGCSAELRSKVTSRADANGASN